MKKLLVLLVTLLLVVSAFGYTFYVVSHGGPADPVSYTHLTLPTICSV